MLLSVRSTAAHDLELQRSLMARNTTVTITSDLSGEPIPEAEAWVVTITPPDGRKASYRLDVTEAEAREWGTKGEEVTKKRGRPRGSKNAPKPQE
jgi:hypothetical protein